MKVIPYVWLKDQWSITYETMAAIWNQMVADGTAKDVFCTGTVINFDAFLKMMQDPQNCPMVIVDDEKPVFFGWINHFSAKSVFVHFCCFSQIWGTGTDEALRTAFNYWFSMQGHEGTPLFETLTGMIASDNRRAIEMVKRVGVVELGTIPNYAVNVFTGKKIGATILYIERKECEKWAE